MRPLSEAGLYSLLKMSLASCVLVFEILLMTAASAGGMTFNSSCADRTISDTLLSFCLHHCDQEDVVLFLRPGATVELSAMPSISRTCNFKLFAHCTVWLLLSAMIFSGGAALKMASADPTMCERIFCSVSAL